MRRFLSILFMLTVIFQIDAATSAKKKITNPDEALEKAREAFMSYNPVEARDYYGQYLDLLKKKKKTAEDDVELEMERIVIMDNMLSRVERIAVVDSLVVDAERFFLNYKLSPETGRLVDGYSVGIPEIETAFITENQTEFFYAEADSTGMYSLMSAGILDDGTVDTPSRLKGDNLSGGGNAEYPFMMTDGITLYFANDGEASLGGYDIFMTRRDDDGSYLQPQNIGMPYNSPYDDYMLAIDETTGVGWWATDRNQIPGKLTIYIFVPSETRINVDEDDDNLVALAKLDNISLTQEKINPDEIKERIRAIDTTPRPLNSTKDKAEFEIAVGSSQLIYHTLGDFRSPSARKFMTEALDTRNKIQSLEKNLQNMRSEWTRGNQTNGTSIIGLEQQLAQARNRMENLINSAISAEQDFISQNDRKNTSTPRKR